MMKSGNILACLVAAACLGCGSEELSGSLVGAWRLASWEQRSASGEVSYPYGEMPEGQIVYTSNGQMSAQLMNPRDTLAGVTASGTEEIVSRVAQNYFAYYGTYTLDELARTVTHHVHGSLASTWVGSDQVRQFEFLTDDRLQLVATIDDDSQVSSVATGQQVLVWERIE